MEGRISGACVCVCVIQLKAGVTPGAFCTVPARAFCYMSVLTPHHFSFIFIQPTALDLDYHTPGRLAGEGDSPLTAPDHPAPSPLPPPLRPAPSLQLRVF
jgi:hypothetical protein